jgi:hypothetical protein
MTLIRQLRYVPVAIVAGLGIASIGLVQPAQALTIGAGDKLTIGGNSIVVNDTPSIVFESNSVAGTGNLTVASGTGGFSSLVTHNGSILNVTPTFANLLNPSGFTRSNFIQIYSEKPSDGIAGNDVFFSLTQYLPPYTDEDIVVAGNPIDRYTIRFKGKFSGAATGVTDGIATFQADFAEGAIGAVYNSLLARLNPTLPPVDNLTNPRFVPSEPVQARGSWTATIEADKIVPTPALLPGIIGLGLTAWRKRRFG